MEISKKKSVVYLDNTVTTVTVGYYTLEIL